MTLTIAPAPIRRSLRVACPPQRAFDTFTARMGTWWHPSHTLLKAPRKEVIVEPRVGGRWFERAVDDSECSWGHVIAWEPPGRLLLAWQLDAQWRFDPALITEVELRFIADGADATLVEFEHRNLERFGELAEKTRAALDSPDAWSSLLERFAAGVAA
jgi:activator of Hsp90 ATPase-like protein